MEHQRMEIICGKCHSVGAILKEDADPLCEHKQSPRVCNVCEPDWLERFLLKRLDNR
jgi:hypothetical protein